MAEAKIVKAVPVPVPPDTVVLTLTRQEAEDLYLVLGQVGGISARRSRLDGIGGALWLAGIQPKYRTGSRNWDGDEKIKGFVTATDL